MICQKCMKRAATVRFTEVVDGKAVNHNLCAECLAIHQHDAAGFSRDVPKPSLRRPRSVQKAPPSATVKRCDLCGAVLSHIVETASVGCAACFGVFGNEIEAILEGLHRSLVHRGKSFKSNDARARLAAEMQTKRSLLRAMLKEENYEEAARLRDEIARLEIATHQAGVGGENG